MRNRLLPGLVFVGAASCANAVPKDLPTVVVPQHAVEAVVAVEPERGDLALPSHAVAMGRVDVRRLDDTIAHVLHDLGPLGLLALEHALDIPNDVLDLAEHSGLGGVLGLDRSRPLTFALQGPSEPERQAAEHVGKLAEPTSFAAFATALGDSPSASFRGRVLLPSPDVIITLGRARALLEGLGFKEEPRAEGIDLRLVSADKDVVIEFMRGRSILTVDVVRCYADNKTQLGRTVDNAFARLREASSEAPPKLSVEGHTFHVEYAPDALAVLDVVTGAHALHAQLTSMDPTQRDSLAAQGVNGLTQSFRLARGDTGVYFDHVDLDDEDNPSGPAFVVTARFGGGTRLPFAVPSPSITLPLDDHPETLDVDRGFLDALHLPLTNLKMLLSTIQMAGGLAYAIALPSVLPWMARDQLGTLGYGPAPVFKESTRTRFERLGLAGNATMPEAIFYGVLPVGASRDTAECALANAIPCSPRDRLILGTTKKYVGPYFQQRAGKSELVVSYARLVAAADRFVVLAANDKKQLERMKAPVFAAMPRAPAYSETSLGTLGSLAGLTLPKLPDRTIVITAMETGDCLGCATTERGATREPAGVVFRLSGR